jgi:Tol biopolymer transport system component
LGHYANPALSPDGQRVAVARTNHETGVLGIWVIELSRRITSPFAVDRRRADMPLWSLDGRRIAFKRPGGFYQRSSGGAGPDELLLPTRRDSYFNPLGWSPDGRLLLYEAGPPPTYRIDLWMVPTLGDRTPAAFTQTEFTETQGQISPDGRWIAYVSDESSRHDVYVRPYPSGAGKWHVSPAGGIEPTWRGDGRELFYLAPDRTLMSVPINGSPTFEAGPATPLFETRMSSFVHPGYTRNQYVVSADGQRLLINQPPAGAPSAPITVVVNWTAAVNK